MDKTVMEKPERRDRNFSIVVPDSQYVALRKISVLADTSLGAVCRQLLQILNYNLYAKLLTIANKEKVSVPHLCKTILEVYVNKQV